MNHKFLKLLFYFIGLISFDAFSQERIDFNFIGGGEGLSENVVNDIIQDANGFMWLATNDGH